MGHPANLVALMYVMVCFWGQTPNLRCDSLALMTLKSFGTGHIYRCGCSDVCRVVPAGPSHPRPVLVAPHIMKTDSRKCERPPSSLASRGDICDAFEARACAGNCSKLRLNQFCFFSRCKTQITMLANLNKILIKPYSNIISLEDTYINIFQSGHN